MTLNDLETISSDIKVNKVNKNFPDDDYRRIGLRRRSMTCAG